MLPSPVEEVTDDDIGSAAVLHSVLSFNVRLKHRYGTHEVI
jgi:hypothetical protein